LKVVRADPAASVPILRIADDRLTPALAQAVGDWLRAEWLPAISAPLDRAQRAAVHRFLGRVSLYRSDYRAATDDYRAAREAEPDDVFVLEGLGEALWRGGKAADAIPVLEQAVRRADAARLRDRSEASRLKLGGAFADLRRYREAIKVLRQGIALAGRLPAELWTALASSRLGLGRSDGAVRAAEWASELDLLLRDQPPYPARDRVRAAEWASELDLRRAAPQAVRAAALLEQGRYPEARDAAEAALGLDTQDLVAARVQGCALLRGKINIDQGIRLLQLYLDRSPRDAESRLLLAGALRSQGRDATRAVRVLEVGLEFKNPDNPVPVALYLELADAYVAAGQTSPALALLDCPEAKGAGESLARWFQVRGDALSAQGDTARALEAYEQAAKASPHTGKLKLKLALAAQKAGNNERAWSAVSEAIKAGVDDDDRARAFELKAKVGDALHPPRDELLEAYYEAGSQFYGKGDLERALLWLRRLTEFEPSYRDARWYEVDSLRQQASQPKLLADPMADTYSRWRKALDSGLPEGTSAWAYVSGALIVDAQGQLCPPAKRAALVWEALAYLERSLVLDESNIYTFITMSRLYRIMNNYANASIASERALRIDPDELAAMDERAAVLGDCGDAQGCRELIDKRLQRERTSWAEGVQAVVLYLEDKLRDAVEQLGRVIESDRADLWGLSYRGFCLRLLALREKAPGEYRERALADYREILGHRGDSAYSAEEATFAEAAYGLGEVQKAVDILTPLLGDALDPTDDYCRTIGCYYLRLGDLDKAEEHLHRGIDHSNTPRQLKTLDSLYFAEIEQDAADWPHRAQVLALLQRARDRIAMVRKRVEALPSPQAELRRFVDWEQARVQTGEWSWIGANAGLARVALGADELEQAEAIYRALGQDRLRRFPEAGLGLAKVAAGYRDLGDEALRKGWDEPDARQEALRLFERALALEEGVSLSDRGKLLVRMALAHFQAGATQSATTTFAAAAKAFEDAGDTDLGARLGETCRTFPPDLTRYWALDAYFRRLAGDQSTPEPLRSILPRTIERLGDYLRTTLDRAGDDKIGIPMAPIVLEIAGNLEPEAGKDKEWLLYKRFLPEMRYRIEDETGVPIPGVRIQGVGTTRPVDTYLIKLDEVPIVDGRVLPGSKYSPSSASALAAAGVTVAELEKATHPLSKQSGWWVPQKYWDRVQKAEDCTLWPDPLQFAVAHLEAVLRSNLADFIGVQEVSNLLKRWGRTDSQRKLIETVLPDAPARDRFVRVLQALARERVPITASEDILKAVREVGLDSAETREVVRRVRLAIKTDLPGNRPGAKLVSVPVEIERAFLPWTTMADGRRFFAIPLEEAQELLTKVRALVQGDDPATVLMTEDADVRDPLRRLVELEFPSITVQSREETLGEEDRESPLAWVPLIAEWGGPWPRSVETCHAS